MKCEKCKSDNCKRVRVTDYEYNVECNDYGNVNKSKILKRPSGTHGAHVALLKLENGGIYGEY